MSQLVYPTLPGLMFDSTRTPIWSTVIKTSANGREYRGQNYQVPRYKYVLKYEVLRTQAGYAELQTLMSFYHQVAGSWDSWLFTDPDDSSVTSQVIGVGNGSTTQFQLVRAFGTFVEPVYSPNVITGVYLNGVLTSAYTVNSTGMITFTSAPGAGVSITWTGTYYWRCRFLADQVEFNKFMNQLWEAKKVEFLTVKP